MNRAPLRPRLRDRLRPLLYPPPGEAVYTSLGRRLFWAALAMLFVAGVLAPYLLAEPLRRLDRALFDPASPDAAATSATQALPAGTRFRDCRDDSCPWLVVLPAGSFTMGSPASEEGRADDEGPQHRVTIGYRLAVMEAEVTRAQFAVFAEEVGYSGQDGCWKLNAAGDKFELDESANWTRPGFDQTPNHPAVCLSWHDGQAYAAWLSHRTGQRYRLLSESEWEYAARAGSSTRFSFGDRDADLCAHGNVADRSAKTLLPHAVNDCDDGAVHTAAVRSYKPNAWGLYDMHGNALEWAQDCGISKGYENAPIDGTADEARDFVGDVCEWRLLRGGAWNSVPRYARSAYRSGGDPADRLSSTGLRLTRMLPQAANPLSP